MCLPCPPTASSPIATHRIGSQSQPLACSPVILALLATANHPEHTESAALLRASSTCGGTTSSPPPSPRSSSHPRLIASRLSARAPEAEAAGISIGSVNCLSGSAPVAPTPSSPAPSRCPSPPYVATAPARSTSRRRAPPPSGVTRTSSRPSMPSS
ncbi:hypothetical protein ACP70R_028114 [Stipagrostis hirtigluma subsp. patula]